MFPDLRLRKVSGEFERSVIACSVVRNNFRKPPQQNLLIVFLWIVVYQIIITPFKVFADQ